MIGKSLNEIKRDIALVTLDIECLDPASKQLAILHLKETIDLLQLGSGELKIDVKQEFNQGVKNWITNTEDLVHNKVPVHNDPITAQPTRTFKQSLYNGLVPTCEFCFATFPTVGALDDHMKKCQAVIKQENVRDRKNIDSTEQSPEKRIKLDISEEAVDGGSNDWMFDDNTFVTNDQVSLTEYRPLVQSIQDNEVTKSLYNGLIPTCDFCGKTFATVGDLDAHLNRNDCNKEGQSNGQNALDVPENFILQEPTARLEESVHEEVNESFDSEGRILETSSSSIKVSQGTFEEDYKLSDESNIVEDSVANDTIDSLGKKYGCQTCEKTFTTAHSLHLHSHTHTDRYKCDECGKRCPSSTVLKKHSCDWVMKNTQSAAQDNIVQASESDEAVLHNHSLECDVEVQETEITSDLFHTPAQSLEQESSNTVYPQELLEIKIDNECKSEEKNLHACPQCGQYYTSVKSLNSHLPIHTDKHKCQKCDSRHTSPSALAKHNCDITLKTRGGKSKSNLLNDVAVAECEVCTLRFASLDTFRTHKITHTDRFKCELCQAGFSLIRDVEKHRMNPNNCKRTQSIRDSAIRRSHLLLKPVETKDISYISVQHEEGHLISDFSRPPQNFEENEEFDMLNCDNCEKYFGSQESLDNHMTQCIKQYL